MQKIEASNVDEYIAAFPADLQRRLEAIRNAIRKTAPHAEECISYMMPTYKQDGVLVHFAGYKNHIGFYPTPSAIEAFKDQLSEWVWSKGAIQFPHDQPLPLKLVKAIVKYRLHSNLEAMKLKKKLKF
jgi:uncharacterized protein YdhG (YjbR/CyaY superfamily)